MRLPYNASGSDKTHIMRMMTHSGRVLAVLRKTRKWREGRRAFGVVGFNFPVMNLIRLVRFKQNSRRKHDREFFERHQVDLQAVLRCGSETL